MMRIVLSAVLFTLSVAVLAFPNAGHSFTPPSPPAPTKNVYQTIASRKELSKFTGMIDEAGLKDLFDTDPAEPVTVFAPSNDALDDLSRDDMRRIEASKDSLQSFVKYHLIAGSRVLSGAIRGRIATPATANGEVLHFDGVTKISEPKVNDAVLLTMDVQATNGIVHVVSTALMPASLQKAPVPTVSIAPVQAPIAATTSTPAAAAVTTTSAGVVTTTSASPKAVAAKYTTTGVAQAPLAASTTGSTGGFTLFGHKFGW